MRIITGDETGLIKQVLIENKRIQRWGTQTRVNSAERMVWAGEEGSEENEIAVARKNGSIQVWDVDRTTIVKEYTGMEGTPKGLGIVRSGDSRKIVSCNEEGNVYLYDWDDSECSNTFEVKAPVNSMRVCPQNTSVFAFGGRENDLGLFDVEKQETIFTARNVPHDWLNLRVPIWIADMSFMSSTGSTYKLATVSGYHHVRLYDTRAQRRPVQSIELGDHPFTRCCVSPDDLTLVTGDTIGRVSRIDLRTMRMTGVYKGATGSIRDIAFHPSGKYLATVGLDRIMRTYDVETRQQTNRVYLRQRLNCVLFSSEEQVQAFAKEEEEEEVNDEVNNEKENEEGVEGEEMDSMSDDGLEVVTDDDDDDDEEEEEEGEEEEEMNEDEEEGEGEEDGDDNDDNEDEEGEDDGDDEEGEDDGDDIDDEDLLGSDD